MSIDCPEPARLVLMAVKSSDRAGAVLLPLGRFCAGHFTIQRARVRAAGIRTGVSVEKDDGPCSWAYSPERKN